MLKPTQNGPDEQAIFEKNITNSLVIGQGQITDTGSGDTSGEALFDITATDTGLIEQFPANGNIFYWGIKFILSNGKPMTYAQGTVRPIHGVVQAIS
jgi:hypothetical protein